MRIGLDLRTVTDPDQRLALTVEADRLGLWAVLLSDSASAGRTGGASTSHGAGAGPGDSGEADAPGTAVLEAAALAPRTSAIHLAPVLDGEAEHPLTLAEEMAVLDHLSERRALPIIDGPRPVLDRVERLLHGAVVDGVALAPPPAQTAMTVWALADVASEPLTGDLAADGELIDRHRDAGTTHLFVRWPGPLPTLARHLVTRAAGPDFPAIVATMADRIDPPDRH